MKTAVKAGSADSVWTRTDVGEGSVSGMGDTKSFGIEIWKKKWDRCNQ